MIETERPSRTGLGYQPALDGVRAIAVMMVLLFHAGFSWMTGGYLGVSIFFTLSGFLITSLLLTEMDHSGRVSLRRFYARRIKRLLPASLLCLFVIVVAYLLGEFRLVKGMRGQLWGAVGQVYNWVRIAGSSSYIELFGQAPVLVSPLEHYWSLAIEEQFYVVWPVVVWAVVRRCRRRGSDTLRSFLLLTALCAVTAPLITMWSSANVAYWSTPTRLGELLVGASAAAWHRRGKRLPISGKWLAVTALLALVILAARLPAGGGPAYMGWMTPIAIISALLLLSLQVPGPIRSMLSSAPMMWIGRLSYGVYLYHWPVFVLLRTHGWTLQTPFGLILALALTAALAALSFFLIERPLRATVWPVRRTFSAALAGLLVATSVIALMPISRGFLEPNREVLAEASIQPEEVVSSLLPPPTTVIAATPTTEPIVLVLPDIPSRPVRILVVGDSTAFYLGQGLADWAVDHPQYAQVEVLVDLGVGFMQDGQIPQFDLSRALSRSKEIARDEMPQLVRDLQPDVVVLMATVLDVADRQWDQLEGPLTPYDTSFRERLLTSYETVTNSLRALGVPTVVWVVPPVPFASWPSPGADVDVGRYLIQHDVIREVSAAEGNNVVVMELDDWFARAGHSDDDWRPDGLHMTEASARQLADDYAGPWVIALALSAAER